MAVIDGNPLSRWRERKGRRCTVLNPCGRNACGAAGAR